MVERSAADFDFMREDTIRNLTDTAKLKEDLATYEVYKAMMEEKHANLDDRREMGAWIAVRPPMR